MDILRVVLIGDVVGDPGLEVLDRRLPLLIKEKSVDFVVANGENAAGGFGLTPSLFERLISAGVDVVTGGNHIWEKREIWPLLDTEKRLIRPMNYPVIAGNTGPRTSMEPTVGKGWVKIEKASAYGNISWVVLNLQGREFMSPLDCPFAVFDSFYKNLEFPGGPGQRPLILLDFHAESTREKEALAYYLDGRVSVIAGTHTHVQTADERILPGGTAYITDLGMSGVQDGVIGMDAKICLDRSRNQVLYRMEIAAPADESKTSIQGILVEIERESGKALSISRL